MLVYLRAYRAMLLTDERRDVRPVRVRHLLSPPSLPSPRNEPAKSTCKPTEYKTGPGRCRTDTRLSFIYGWLIKTILVHSESSHI